jgi:hypothetical protein
MLFTPVMRLRGERTGASGPSGKIGLKKNMLGPHVIANMVLAIVRPFIPDITGLPMGLHGRTRVKNLSAIKIAFCHNFSSFLRNKAGQDRAMPKEGQDGNPMMT